MAATPAPAHASPAGHRVARRGGDAGPRQAAGLRAQRTWWQRLHTRAVPVPPDRLEAAMQAKRPAALAGALLLFAAGFTVDDARVLRLPGYLLGSAAAVCVLAFGPLWMGRRFALDHRGDDEAAFAERAAQSRRLGALAVLLAFLLVLAWLAVFSAGVPPWAG